MKALLFSDIHDSGRGLWALTDFLSKNKDIGGIVFAGDLTNMGEPVSFAEKFIAEISQFNIPLLWVPGNNDFGTSYKVLQNHTLSLEGCIVKIGNRDFTGIGGSPASWSGQYQGENSLSKEDIAGTILVTHYPPIGVRYAANSKSQTLNSKQIQNLKSKNSNEAMPAIGWSAFGGKQLNPSTTLGASNEIRLADAPLAHICGHIHHTWGIGYIGQTKVIKLASLQLGYLAIMNLDNLAVEFMRMT